MNQNYKSTITILQIVPEYNWKDIRKIQLYLDLYNLTQEDFLKESTKIFGTSDIDKWSKQNIPSSIENSKMQKIGLIIKNIEKTRIEADKKMKQLKHSTLVQALNEEAKSLSDQHKTLMQAAILEMQMSKHYELWIENLLKCKFKCTTMPSNIYPSTEFNKNSPVHIEVRTILINVYTLLLKNDSAEYENKESSCISPT